MMEDILWLIIGITIALIILSVMYFVFTKVSFVNFIK